MYSKITPEQREKRRLYQIEYRKNNKDKIREIRHLPENVKKNRINLWKYRGVISEDFDALYDIYLNTTHCNNPECKIKLTQGGMARKCLDHCHKTGQFRDILCDSCNISRR